jgi:ATP-dependent helicase/nuclease subunit A
MFIFERKFYAKIMPQNLINIYKASAGSGKTFRLTYDFIKFLFESRGDKQAYRHILAVTFTHKATDEMKRRIIKELFALTKGQSQYLKMLNHDFPQLSQENIKSVSYFFLNNILHDYSGFYISTIDGFFQQIVTAFTRELSLDGYAIEMNSEEVLGYAINNMLLNLDKPENGELLKWLIKFSEDRIDMDSKWDFRSEIKGLSKEIFKENYKKHIKSLASKLANKTFLSGYQKQLQQIVDEFEHKMSSIGEAAEAVLKKYNLQSTDFKGKSRSFCTIFFKIRNQNYEVSDSVKNAQDNVEEWYTKNSPKEQDIINSYDDLNPLLVNTISLIEGDSCKAYKTAKVILKNLYVLGILSDVETSINQYTAENNLMLFNNISEFLESIIAGSDTPFIYEKTGVSIAHYMIDEFQDTSTQQWNNFLPLLRNSVASGNENLIVGDVKQSIYRWRNSDWKLLNNKVSSDFAAVKPQVNVLDTNWRSDKNIIQFNNHLFPFIADKLANTFGNTQEEQERATIIRQVYSDVIQKSTKELEGNVQITLIKDKNWKETALNNLAETIENMQDNGYSLRQMAILTRENKEAIEIAQFLMNYANTHPEKEGYSYDVISNEALLVNSALSVQFLITVLNYLSFPQDKHNNAILITQYVALKQEGISNRLLNILMDGGDWQTELMGKERAAALEQLEYTSLFDLTEQLIAIFDLSEFQNDMPFIQAFQDCIYDFSLKKESDIKNFLEYWDEKSVKQYLPVPDSQNAIRIMTIHSSKGLEFDTVLIPFCDWTFINSKTRILWCETHEEPFNDLPITPINYTKDLDKTYFDNEYYDETLYNYIDTLNLLYVAFTRAISNLYIWTEPLPKTPSKANRFVERFNDFYLQDTFKFDKIEETDEMLRLILGSIKPKSANKMTVQNQPEKYISVSAFDRLKLHYQHMGNNDDMIVTDNNRQYGVIMHNLIANIQSIKDINYQSQMMVDRGFISQSDKNQIDSDLKDFFNNQQVQDWFSGKYQVHTETEILLSDGSIYRPDRVMIDGKRAIVVDYKFGKNKEEKYCSQVQQYADLLTKMGYETEAFLYYATLQEIDRV